ncbi:MAG: hypothetical protein ABR606_17670 [Vicinamibacterales bacterium]
MAHPSNNPAPHARETDAPAHLEDGTTPNMAAPPELVEGQLGPDELPEPDEVVQSNLAKLRSAGRPEKDEPAT